MKNIDELYGYFPAKICEEINKTSKNNLYIENELQEIRLRVGNPIILKSSKKEILLNYKINQMDLLQIVEKLCNNSIYAYKNQICEGFITVKGGHRVGITGSAVIENRKIINIKYITSLNFRVARQVKDCSFKILGQVLDLRK